MAITTTAGAAQVPGSRTTAITPRVFVIHGDESVRDGLELMIEASGREPATYTSGQEFLACPRPSVASCLILDTALPDVSGLELQRRLVRDRPELPVIFVTGHSDITTSVCAMKAGAVEFLIAPVDDEMLLAAIDDALERSRRALEHHAKLKAVRENYALLTAREREVMALVVSGLLNKQIGGELGISEITVKAHRGQVMRKMKADSLAALVKMAATLGLTPPTGLGAVAAAGAERWH